MGETAVRSDLDIEWRAGRLALGERVHVMGIVNVTPDSFSDGGRFASPGEAVAEGLRMLDEGADVIDVGGESTRPGAPDVPAGEETRRVLPVIEGLRARTGAAISVDTRKAGVAREALVAGADIVNDVSALRDDPEMAPLCAERGAPVVLMHMKGAPRDMQDGPSYRDLMGEVRAFLEDAIARAERAGIERARTLVDPGIGFGKTVEHNLALVNRLGELAPLGRPILVGASRKSFIGRTLGRPGEPLPTSERLEGTLAATVLAVARGARMVRVHDVRACVRAVRMAEAILRA